MLSPCLFLLWLVSHFLDYSAAYLIQMWEVQTDQIRHTHSLSKALWLWFSFLFRSDIQSWCSSPSGSLSHSYHPQFSKHWNTVCGRAISLVSLWAFMQYSAGKSEWDTSSSQPNAFNSNETFLYVDPLFGWKGHGSDAYYIESYLETFSMSFTFVFNLLLHSLRSRDTGFVLFIFLTFI